MKRGGSRQEGPGPFKGGACASAQRELVGRHLAIEELQEWTWTGEPLVPLKGFPGVVWQRSKKKRRAAGEDPFELAREDT